MHNLLNEKIKIVIKMADQAFQNLPTITEEDIRTGQEKYRLLLGDWKFISPTKMLVGVEAILEFPDSPIYYTERKEAIKDVDILAIKNLVSGLQKHFAEYQSLKLVGEIHYHPALQKDMELHQRSWHMSTGDKESLISSYQHSILNSKEPFLIGIAGAMEGGQTGYAFYRMVKKGDLYFIRPVDWPEGGS